MVRRRRLGNPFRNEGLGSHSQAEDSLVAGTEDRGSGEDSQRREVQADRQGAASRVLAEEATGSLIVLLELSL